eukprot:TRINITY_DN8667_c1_g1_i1.p1 TRINITY_DN8667_c1_g1~~TRINITY_DN8667_c1_g1_i1.p1  ORF type:complete len:1052 (-),score=213.38 TRINITY_DN8667_c1_g1_i1:57-3143(-)
MPPSPVTALASPAPAELPLPLPLHKLPAREHLVPSAPLQPPPCALTSLTLRQQEREVSPRAAVHDGGVDLHFDELELAEIDQAVFKRDIIESFRARGADEAQLRLLRIRLRAGSVIAEVRVLAQGSSGDRGGIASGDCTPRALDELKSLLRCPEPIKVQGVVARVVEVPAATFGLVASPRMPHSGTASPIPLTLRFSGSRGSSRPPTPPPTPPPWGGQALTAAPTAADPIFSIPLPTALLRGVGSPKAANRSSCGQGTSRSNSPLRQYQFPSQSQHNIRGSSTGVPVSSKRMHMHSASGSGVGVKSSATAAAGNQPKVTRISPPRFRGPATADQAERVVSAAKSVERVFTSARGDDSMLVLNNGSEGSEEMASGIHVLGTPLLHAGTFPRRERSGANSPASMYSPERGGSGGGGGLSGTSTPTRAATGHATLSTQSPHGTDAPTPASAKGRRPSPAQIITQPGVAARVNNATASLAGPARFGTGDGVETGSALVSSSLGCRSSPAGTARHEAARRHPLSDGLSMLPISILNAQMEGPSSVASDEELSFSDTPRLSASSARGLGVRRPNEDVNIQGSRFGIMPRAGGGSFSGKNIFQSGRVRGSSDVSQPQLSSPTRRLATAQAWTSHDPEDGNVADRKPSLTMRRPVAPAPATIHSPRPGCKVAPKPSPQPAPEPVPATTVPKPQEEKSQEIDKPLDKDAFKVAAGDETKNDNWTSEDDDGEGEESEDDESDDAEEMEKKSQASEGTGKEEAKKENAKTEVVKIEEPKKEELKKTAATPKAALEKAAAEKSIAKAGLPTAKAGAATAAAKGKSLAAPSTTKSDATEAAKSGGAKPAPVAATKSSEATPASSKVAASSPETAEHSESENEDSESEDMYEESEEEEGASESEYSDEDEEEEEERAEDAISDQSSRVAQAAKPIVTAPASAKAASPQVAPAAPAPAKAASAAPKAAATAAAKAKAASNVGASPSSRAGVSPTAASMRTASASSISDSGASSPVANTPSPVRRVGACRSGSASPVTPVSKGR